MTENNVRIMCPNLVCRKVLIVPTSSRGKTVRCKNCATTIRVPAKAPAPAAFAPPPGAGAGGAGGDAKVA